ncbi:alpha-hydroxy acid oxidase [Fuscibacter oryzae]|uniref:Alpha-hydroxy-acid oxidizing protein n=1 Tax=Fuscibacter oryzae TaxID=2803939 RepID=A0A8J7MUC0_9RHOB|nr:alpha-hydroxy acid oxidase [Fuscibacter oryzae]MBL4929741.1 alpha-hydroxy-acid oxidizing protein [Fuscibacter oryzae]
MPTCPLDEYEALAAGAMDPAAFAYVAGGAGAEVTLRRNATSWADVVLRPRLMRDMAGFSTTCALPGLDLAFPCLVAPMAYQRLAHAEGEAAMARAAAAQGAGIVLSCQTSVDPEQVVVAPFWFQLYLQPDPAATRALAARALACGAAALVVTLDAPLNGIRNREIAAGFALPRGIRPVMLDALPPVPPPEGDPIAGLLARAPTWADLAALCAESPVPVLAKGVLTPEDALLAMQAGCAGVIVSNHGARVLDGLPATAHALPAIRAALPGVPVLADGGIRSGDDMLRALALGADAVLLGRPAFYALALGGAAQVSTCLRRLRDEFAVAMGLMGLRSVDEIGPECLFT